MPQINAIYLQFIARLFGIKNIHGFIHGFYRDKAMDLSYPINRKFSDRKISLNKSRRFEKSPLSCYNDTKEGCL